MRVVNCVWVVVLISLMSSLGLSATIIITPSSPREYSSRQTQTVTSINTTQLIQFIKEYFGCGLFMNGNCIKCENKYVLNRNAKCSRVSDECRIFNIDQGVCTQCLNSFSVVDGVCFANNQTNPIKNHCVVWNERQCFTCEKAYFLFKGTCKPIDAQFQCRTWNDKGACQSCNNGYSLVNGQCVQSQKLIKCLQNEYLSANSKCELVPANCQTWDPNSGKCVKCMTGFDLAEWKCKCSAKSYCQNQNCARYNLLNPKSCDVCEDGYILQNGKCSEKPLPHNCLRWNQNKTECAECLKTHVLTPESKQCVALVQNCLSYDILGNCVGCVQQFQLNQKKCQQTVTIPHCQIYNAHNKKLCSVCQLGFNLNNNSCAPKPLPANCLKWDELFTACAQCDQKLILTNGGQCVQQIQNCISYGTAGQCTACYEEYFLFETKCQKHIIVPHCLKSQPQNKNQCSECQIGYQLRNNQCIQKQLPQNCIRWDDAKTFCAQCGSNFILNLTTGQCAEQVVNCIAYSESGQCLACNQNYEVSDQICTLKANNMTASQFYGCDTWNFTASKCNTCYQDFDLNKQGYCIYDEDHCVERNSNNYCIKCKEGYTVNAGNCQFAQSAHVQIQTKAGCKLYDWVNNVCLVCEDEFVKLQNGQCERPIENCLEQGVNGCIKCVTNCDLIRGKCVSFAQSRCTAKNEKGGCKRCENSFALIGGECRTFKQLGTILLDYNQFSPQKLKQKIVIFTDKAKF